MFYNISTNSFYIYYLTILLNFIKNLAFSLLSNNIINTPKASVEVNYGNFVFQVKTRIKILFNLFCISYYFITNYIIKGVQYGKATK